MKRLLAAVAAALVACVGGAVGSGTEAQGGTPACRGSDSEAFGFTGSEQCYDVPAGVSAIRVEAIGGTGGDAPVPGATGGGSPGGAGVAISGVLPVEPGQRLYVNVAGNGSDGSRTGTTGPLDGGYGGGGGTDDRTFGASGGGATDIRTVTCGGNCFESLSLSSRLLVAAGGAGGGYDPDGRGSNVGGAGGVAEGSGGPARGMTGGSGFEAGRGGTESAGGASGRGSPYPGGALGLAGQGYRAGGGGGGLYGGGGGADFEEIDEESNVALAGAGGGGGSSLLPEGFRSDLDETGEPVVVIDAVRPTVRTGRATERGCRSAMLTGAVNPGGPTTAYGFTYGLKGKPFSGETRPRDAGGTEDIEVRQKVRGLKPGRVYRFRLDLFDIETKSGGVKSFRTKTRC